MDNYHENAPPSMLRPPSKIQALGKLSEMSGASINSRGTGMPPPATGQKRKTLVETAGEPPRPPPPAPSSRLASNHTRANSVNGAYREPSYSSSVSSRPSSASSLRNLSNGSFSSSAGSNKRPQSAQSQRYHSSFGASRLQKPGYTPSRPATALEVHQEERFGEDVQQNQMAWDHDRRLKEIEQHSKKFNETYLAVQSEKTALQEAISVYKTRVNELETSQAQLTAKNEGLLIELESARARLKSSEETQDDISRRHKIEIEDTQRQHRLRMEDAQHSAESQARRLIRDQAERFDETRRKMESEVEEKRKQLEGEIQAVKREGLSCQEEADRAIEKQKDALQSLEAQLEVCKQEMTRENDANFELRSTISSLTAARTDLETNVQRLESHIRFLESDNKSQSHAFADLEARMQSAIKSAAEANEKLITEETLRRKLHNQVQELKGNIRVFCRARPALEHDNADNPAKISYPDDKADCKEIEIMGPEEKSSLGNITTRRNAFAFDRVFGPTAQNEDVFGEISQLVQSALDGYNVCIFCYGQTGSGKTFTMSAEDGMIPRAVHQIYDTAKSLEEKGWSYKMEGSFIEVYNENLNDLLGKAEEFDKKKHEIKHDLQKGKTTITGVTSVGLDSPDRVNSILARATSNRSVAATQANERSSRSHSVFILKLLGENSITGERSEGTLNLVDLAGSERLSHSGATGERLKETQNINKSLSCLGDVIAALGQGKEGVHVPYRNSKLTYLLQNSLGGNSKTLMFVMISPLQAHLSETITSLKFATKVHNTHIGTAKKQAKV